MTEKINAKKTGAALAIVSSIIYALCVIAIVAAPGVTLEIFSAMFHGIDITKISSTPVSFIRTIVGFIEINLLSFISGWLFAVIYNSLTKKEVE
ncbi:hypothetical protein HZB00_00540 [Candidatus Woesearchaeota archaeon]|nr:hypothetical protein [Candidatus Woesearchaeota archaeon]